MDGGAPNRQSMDIMTPGEVDVACSRIVKELLEACTANEGGPHRWRVSDVGESFEPTVKDRMGRSRVAGPTRVKTNLTAECICGVTVRASKDHIAPGRSA
jgi:hypothetical protein